ncbi:unnamed protein product, partial [Sphacelaria rigidula]
GKVVKGTVKGTAAPRSAPDGASGGTITDHTSIGVGTAAVAVGSAPAPPTGLDGSCGGGDRSAAGNCDDVSVVDKKGKRKVTKSGSKGKAVCCPVLAGDDSVAASGDEDMLATAQKAKKPTIDIGRSNAAPPSDPDGARGGRSGSESSVRAVTATAAVAKVTFRAPIYTVHSGNTGNTGEISEFFAGASIGGYADEDRVKGDTKRKRSAKGEEKGYTEAEAEEGLSVEECTAAMVAIADEGRRLKRVKVVASIPGQKHRHRDDTAQASAVEQPSPVVATKLPPAVPTESAGTKTKVAVPPPNVDHSEANATSSGPTIDQQAPVSGTAAAAPVRATIAT